MEKWKHVDIRYRSWKDFHEVHGISTDLKTEGLHRRLAPPAN